MTPQTAPQSACFPPVPLRPGRDVLRIALVNNLPDAALRSTERQFCALLAGASGGLTIKLDLYTLSGIARGRDTQDHLAEYYEDLAEIETSRPDGIIVTGTEPRERCLTDEAFWPAFIRLYDFAAWSAVPVIWCCLAAHAAVFLGDGIERIRLPKKLSGLYESHVAPRTHDIMRGMPRRWLMPQSRTHGLSERLLTEHGYEVAAGSRLTGPDVFLRRGPACQVFLQGHPEYQAHSLVSEFRRDVKRFLRGELGEMPAPPANVFPSRLQRRLARGQHEISRRRDPASLATIDLLLDGLALEAKWEAAACTFYSNWVTHLSEVACSNPASPGRPVPALEAAIKRALVVSEAAL